MQGIKTHTAEMAHCLIFFTNNANIYLVNINNEYDKNS